MSRQTLGALAFLLNGCQIPYIGSVQVMVPQCLLCEHLDWVVERHLEGVGLSCKELLERNLYNPWDVGSVAGGLGCWMSSASHSEFNPGAERE